MVLATVVLLIFSRWRGESYEFDRMLTNSNVFLKKRLSNSFSSHPESNAREQFEPGQKKGRAIKVSFGIGWLNYCRRSNL